MTQTWINRNSGVAVGTVSVYHDPDIDPPPRGVQLWVMTKTGVLVRSVWNDNSGFLAWAPLPDTPDWLKRKLTAAYNSMQPRSAKLSESMSHGEE